MKTGKVKFFNSSKGYGFIVEEGTGKEYFVHVTGLREDVKEGDLVTFDLKEGKKGPNAIDVRLA
jgi:CspA family cold shock protein